MACDLVHSNAHKSTIQAKNDAAKNHRLYRKGPFSFPTHHEDDRREQIREREREGTVETCPPPLSGDRGSSLKAEREAERTFKASQNDIGEQGHDGCADEARDGHSDKPGHEDVSKQPPVHCLPGAQPADRHHWPNLKKERDVPFINKL